MTEFSSGKRKNLDMDAAGTAASLLCAVHCALMPMLITLLPLVGLGFLASEGIEWTLLALSAIVGCTSLCFGYRTHRRRAALAVLATGLALLAMGRLCEERGIDKQGLALVVLGGITVAGSHIFNRRLCAACRTCSRGTSATPPSR